MPSIPKYNKATFWDLVYISLELEDSSPKINSRDNDSQLKPFLSSQNQRTVIIYSLKCTTRGPKSRRGKFRRKGI
jgi:hypothetical protein